MGVQEEVAQLESPVVAGASADSATPRKRDAGHVRATQEASATVHAWRSGGGSRCSGRGRTNWSSGGDRPPRASSGKRSSFRRRSSPVLTLSRSLAAAQLQVQVPFFSLHIEWIWLRLVQSHRYPD